MAKKNDVIYVARNRVLVRPGKGKKQVDFKPGMIITPGALPEREIASLLKDGFIVARGTAVEETSESTPIAHIKPDGTVTAAKPLPAVGKWNLDPALLKGKSIEELNAIVIDRDAAVTPFDEVAEAVKFLSSEFQG